MKKESGITLIALIVTIIVMLILAGVSINAIIGDNGILSQATNAANATDIADVKEQIQVALTNYYDDLGRYTEDDVWSAVDDVLGEGSERDTENYTVQTAKGNTVDISDLIAGASETTVADSDSTEDDGVTASDVNSDPATYYGAVVTNYIVADGDLQDDLDEEGIEWKIFYADDDNIYLIASDYVPVENAPSSSAGSPVYSSSYPYSLDLSNVYSAYSGASDITDSNLIKWNSLYFASYSDSTGDNMKCVAYLMDKDLWSDYTNSNYASYSIGSPTLELWVASWNDMGYETITCLVYSSEGYYVGTEGHAGYIWDLSGYASEEKNLSLYFLDSKSTVSNYLLASPGCGSGYVSYSVASLGMFPVTALAASEVSNCIVLSVGQSDIDVSYGDGKLLSLNGFRPVVCLKSGVQLQENEDGSYSIVQ